MSVDDIDRLSTLPEEITSRILSLMPTKFAVRTSILSRKWRYSWTTVTNLVFEDLHPNFFTKYILNLMDNQPTGRSDNFPKFVDRVLEFCRSPKIHLFRLHLLDSCASNLNLLSWIDKAVRLNVCELDIQAPIGEVPLNLLTCKTLTNLRLDYACGIYNLWKPSCQLVDLPCLKTLDIGVSVNPFAHAFKLINGCPILESLSLKVKWCETEGDYVFNIPTLKRLELTVDRASLINKVVLNVPNLEYLFVSGTLCSVFVMEDVPALIEASVAFSCIMMGCLWVELLKELHGIKSLSARISSFMYLHEYFTRSLPIFPIINRLDLNGCCYSHLVLQFLERSPELQHLSIEKVPSMIPQPGLSSWIEPKLVPACIQTTLTTIKLCDGEKSDMKFLEYVLGNARVLKRVTITWIKDLCMEEHMRLASQMLSFAKASAHCEVWINDVGFCYRGTQNCVSLKATTLVEPSLWLSRTLNGLGRHL